MKGMRSYLRLTAFLACSLSLLLFGSSMAANDKKQDQKKEDPQTVENLRRLEELVQANKRYASRKNGVLLQAKATVQKNAFKPKLILDWTITYDGPRPPLNMLKPSLMPWASGQTYVLFHAVGENGALHVIPIHPDPPGFLISFYKEHFLTIGKHESATGSLEIPFNLNHLAPLRLYVQLRHNPMERGDFLNLDAWTGFVQTEFIDIRLSDLK